MNVQYLGINPFDAFKSFFNKKPLFIVFSPTSRCNAFCRHCFNWKNVKNSGKRNELSLQEIKKISSNLGNMKYITLTGGEPFLRKDIDEIMKMFHFQNKTTRMVVHTNGSFTDKIISKVEKVLKSCPKLCMNLYVSIDHLFDKHDKIRNNKGLFEKALMTIKKAKKLESNYKNLSVKGVGCLSKLNSEDIGEINRFMKQKVRIHYGIALLRGDVFNAEEIKVGYEEYKNMYNSLKEQYKKRYFKEHSVFYLLRNVTEGLQSKIIMETLQKKKSLYPCKAGSKVIVIMDNGDVYPCELINKVEKMGNLRDVEYDLRKILNSDKGKKIIGEIKDSNCWCTWECIIPINLIFNIQSYPLIIRIYLEIIAAYFYHKQLI